MKDKNPKIDEQPKNAPEIDDIMDSEDETPQLEDALNNEMNLAEQLKEQLDAAQTALEKEKKEYMFLMADFDNFRKRVRKEKEELLQTAGEKVLLGLLPIVDDFERGLDATKNADDAAHVREGMELIYNKLVKYLEQNGVTAMDSTGKDFDADIHDAIATIPAPTPDLKGKVIDTTQKGYMLKDKVLRHAKVAVGE